MYFFVIHTLIHGIGYIFVFRVNEAALSLARRLSVGQILFAGVLTPEGDRRWLGSWLVETSLPVRHTVSNLMNTACLFMLRVHCTTIGHMGCKSSGYHPTRCLESGIVLCR